MPQECIRAGEPTVEPSGVSIRKTGRVAATQLDWLPDGGTQGYDGHMISRTPAVLYRRFGDRWYVITGYLDDKYDRYYYRENGQEFLDQDSALVHANNLARALRLPESEIVEDLGAGD